MEHQNSNGNTKKDVYAIVNQKIIDQLEKGTVPWLQPWTVAGWPKNLVSGKSYRGINIMVLGCMDEGWSGGGLTIAHVDLAGDGGGDQGGAAFFR